MIHMPFMCIYFFPLFHILFCYNIIALYFFFGKCMLNWENFSLSLITDCSQSHAFFPPYHEDTWHQCNTHLYCWFYMWKGKNKNIQHSIQLSWIYACLCLISKYLGIPQIWKLCLFFRSNTQFRTHVLFSLL